MDIQVEERGHEKGIDSVRVEHPWMFEEHQTWVAKKVWL